MDNSPADEQDEVREFIKEWDAGKRWIDGFTRDFPELDNLADAVALSSSKKAPMVGDVSLASSVRQIPRASIQQLPAMSVEVNGTKLSMPAHVCEFLVRRMVFNQDTFGKGILSTMQIGAESALTHGFQAAMASIGNIMNDFGSTMRLIHYNDVVIEPGVFDISDTMYSHVRTRVTRNQLKKLRDRAKANPNTTWDPDALTELIALDPTTDNLSRYVSQPRENQSLNMDNETYDIITRYEYGPFGEIVTYATNLPKPLREYNSKSKFGYPRVNFLVIDPAQLTPFGVSRVRLASPSANYANIYLQSTAKMLLLNADPPVFKKGSFTTPITLKRGALWETADPTAEVKLQELSNSTLTQFENVLKFVDGQIYAIMGVTPNNLPGGQPAGGGAYQNKVSSTMEKSSSDMATTQITNIVENFIRQYALTALDLFISEQVGETPLIVDDKCKNAINQIARGEFDKAHPVDPMTGMPAVDPATGMPPQYVPTIGDDNVININWADFYAGIKTWTVDIDLSMSGDQLEEKKRGDLQDMLTVSSQTADPNDPVARSRKMALEDELLKDVAPDVAKQTDTTPQAQPVAPPQPEQVPPV
jgi:hypothetical protein